MNYRALVSLSCLFVILAHNCVGQESGTQRSQGIDGLADSLALTQDLLKQVQIKVVANTIQSPEVAKFESAKDPGGEQTRFGVWPGTEFLWSQGRGEWSCVWKYTPAFSGVKAQPHEEVWTFKQGMASRWILNKRFMEKTIGAPALPFPDVDELCGYVIAGNPKLSVVDLLRRASSGEKAISFADGKLIFRESEGWESRITFNQTVPPVPIKIEVIGPGSIVARQQEIEWKAPDKNNVSYPAKVILTSYQDWKNPATWYKEIFEISIVRAIASVDITHPAPETLPDGTFVRDHLMRTESVVEKGKLKAPPP